MKITILRLIEDSPDGALVEFSTPFGRGISYFCEFIPEEKQSYDVELNIDDDFLWNENLSISKKTVPSIDFEVETLNITAQLISSEDDGCAAIKIDNSISLISLPKTHYPLPIFVELSAKETSLHPTNI